MLSLLFLNSKSMHEKQKCGESRLFTTQKYTQSHFVSFDQFLCIRKPKDILCHWASCSAYIRQKNFASFGYSLCACKKTLRLEIAALNFKEYSVPLGYSFCLTGLSIAHYAVYRKHVPIRSRQSLLHSRMPRLVRGLDVPFNHLESRI